MLDSGDSTWLLKAERNENTSDVEDDSQSVQPMLKRGQDTTCIPRHSFLVGATLFVFFVLNNLVWYTTFHRTLRSRELLQASGPAHNNLTYFLNDGEAERLQVPFEHDWSRLEEIEVNGYRYGDVHWTPGSFAPREGGVVSVPRKLQADLGLDLRAGLDPEDSSRAIYLVAGFHQLHCMQVVRDAIYYLNGTIEWPSPPFQWSHILHCVEAVRQAVSCALDPTLIPLNSTWPGIPNGQVHTCRNFDALFRWAEQHERSLPNFEVMTEGPHTQEWLQRVELSGEL